jgi:Sec-independent protein translocase protein TatA
MSDLENIFNTMSSALYGFKNDLEKMQGEMKKEAKEELIEKKRIITSSSVEPMTILRKNASEVKQAKENPREAFINDRLADILGG